MILRLTLFLFLITFITKAQELSLEVVPVFGKEKLIKDKKYLTSKGDTVQFKKIQFYITDVKLSLKDGSVKKIDSSHYLINVFNESTLIRKLGISQSLAVQEVCFSLGVRGDLSEAGALAGDLDPIHGMYWAWQTGYINLKIEGVSQSCPTRKNKFTYHIGGYKEPYTTLQKICLPVSINKEAIRVKIDIAKFFNDIDLSKHHSLMIPGKEALELAQKSVKMFSLEK